MGRYIVADEEDDQFGIGPDITAMYLSSLHIKDDDNNKAFSVPNDGIGANVPMNQIHTKVSSSI